MTDTDILPRAISGRWQPLRLGLVDLFYYDDEQFWFHDGRLLLRGNNGTGKSKVLALTLPLLLDGAITPWRVEPDADPKKRMEWNLLLGGAHPNSERTGYTWVEFGRRDTDGTEHYTTLGMGLKAAAGRGIVKKWYFTSNRRIGDLRLLDDSRTVLSQERLRDELAATASGQVHTGQEAYRRAVDEALFRLGEERYAALIDLLIQLRQPQLSKKPDEKALSAALTEALTPIDQAVLADVAESFRSLEEERADVADARETLRAAEDFLRHYRVYARIASRRHTTAMRLANSAYEHAGRSLREAEDRQIAARSDIERLARLHAEADERQSTLRGQEQALRTSPEMKDADRLEQSATAAADAERRAAAAGREVERAVAAAEQEAGAQTVATERLEEATTEAGRQEASATRWAAAAGLQSEHAVVLADPDAASRALGRRREQAAHVRRLLAEADQRAARAEHRRQALDAIETDAATRAEEVRAAHDQVDIAVASYQDSIRALVTGLRAIELEADADELAALAEGWAQSMAGESPVRATLEAAATTTLNRLGRERATADHEATRICGDLDAVRSEIAALEAGREPEPPPVPGRDQAARQNRSGAPLWWLTDFADAVPDTERAGLEAALQSAGLLDAWIFPDGTVQTEGDVVLSPSGALPERSLAGMLNPAAAADSGVDGETVRAVLSRIGLGEQKAVWWVDAGGRWGAGPARGSWHKERAEFLGAGAREAHRQHLLARLRAQTTELGAALEAARSRVAEAERQTERVQAEKAGYPSRLERELVTAHDRVATAQREVERAEQAVIAARASWQEAAEEAEAAADELTVQAGQLAVGTTSGEIDALVSAVTSYEVALVEARRAARMLTDATTAHDVAARRVAEADGLRDLRITEHQDLRTQAAALRARYDELRATVGASVAELQARLAAVVAKLEQMGREMKRVAADQLAASAQLGRAEESVSDLEHRREETAHARERTVATLRSFAGTGLLRVALPDLVVPAPDADAEWTVTAAVALSRAGEQLLAAADESDDAWARAQQRISSASTELTSQMSRHGHTAFIEQHEDVLVARVLYLHEEVDVDRLAIRLSQDVADRERLLSAREREILENHLVNEVAGHLHELLLTAEQQIDQMNRELAQRRTSTGMQLRVRWRERSDGPAGLTAARGLMVRSDATWTPADRAAIGAFLQAQIAGARDADPTGSWQEHLEQALDYRHWHTFAVERWQNGQWRSASGPASGGERALAVSVPLFAAASAHYNSAGPHAPRLILLDEAFAGVDDDSRAKSLGLLATFDLDVVMTSEREWGCYPQVPGLAIAQLSRVEGVDAVGITRWRWDGRQRARVAEVDDAARAGGAPGSDGSAGWNGAAGSIGAADSADTDETLFD